MRPSFIVPSTAKEQHPIRSRKFRFKAQSGKAKRTKTVCRTKKSDGIGLERLLERDPGIISKYFKVYIFDFYDIFYNLKAILLTFRKSDI